MLTVSLPSESDNLMVMNFWRKEMFLQLYPPGGFRKLRQGEKFAC
jgi:hypothetical protein|tara:strand:- start:579 stop:713 length:135 start_codon:yes stop_codon:yes gene_type:complete